MIFTKKIQKAINISSRLHKHHIRAGTNLPYIVHPYSVALILSSYDESEDVICAGLLHDVLEDAPDYTYENMVSDFGDKIAQIVMWVTENKRFDQNNNLVKESWNDRKASYLNNIQNAPREALMVSSADTIQNLNSLLETYEVCGDNMWLLFNASMEQKMRFYMELIEIISERLDSSIVNDLRESFLNLTETISSPNEAISDDSWRFKASLKDIPALGI